MPSAPGERTRQTRAIPGDPWHPPKRTWNPTSTCWWSGAGVTGIYQLYRAREAGFSVALVEAGSGVGGTWFWNRYPGARFDSESYTYGYLFSRELFEEWEWQEHFAPQPETERYLNHVVDRFDLRRHMRFDARVTLGRVRRAVGHLDGRRLGRRRRRGGRRPDPARFLIAATGVLSVPYTPDVPGREDFRGEAYHTGLLAGRARRLRRQAGGGRRHLVERGAGRVRPSSTTSRSSPSTSAPPTGARRSTTRPSRPRSRRSCGPTSTICARS